MFSNKDLAVSKIVDSLGVSTMMARCLERRGIHYFEKVKREIKAERITNQHVNASTTFDEYMSRLHEDSIEEKKYSRWKPERISNLQDVLEEVMEISENNESYEINWRQHKKRID